MKIAVDAREREVVHVIGIAVLHGNDVFDSRLQTVNRPDATGSIAAIASTSRTRALVEVSIAYDVVPRTAVLVAAGEQ